MSKIIMETGVRYDAILKDIVVGPIKYDILIKLFSDGRVGGRLVEPLISELFDDFQCSVGGNKYDIKRISNGKEQEVKSFTKSSGCKLIPSRQIGTQRSYDQSVYHKYINEKESFIIVDIRNLPKVSIISIPSSDILNNYPGTQKTQPKVDDSIFNVKKIIDLGEV